MEDMKFGKDDFGSDKGYEKGDRNSRGGGFGRKKVCPFILDKTLVLDYKSLKVMQRFISETGKIVPRRVSGATAKSQRRLTKQIKRARSLGFLAPLVSE